MVTAAEATTRWRDAALRVQQQVLSREEVGVVLDGVAAAARDLVDGDVATLAAPHVAGQSLSLVGASGYRADDLRHAVYPIAESLSGEVMTTGTGLRVADASQACNAYQPVCELGDMGPTLIVPLEGNGTPFGSLLVARRRGSTPFDDDALTQLELFAGQVAVAVEVCRARRELERLASLEQTERVGRELHDTVVQRLFASGMTLEALAARWPAEVAAHVRPVLDQLDGIVREIRATVLDPAPAPRAVDPPRVAQG